MRLTRYRALALLLLRKNEENLDGKKSLSEEEKSRNKVDMRGED